MSYREDTAALRARIRELEGELDHMREQVERVDTLENRFETLAKRRGVELSRRAVYGAVGVAGALAIGGLALHFEVEDLESRVFAAEANARNANGAANAALQNAQRAQHAAAHPPGPPPFDTVVRPGTVESVTGDAAVEAGDTCTVKVMPSGSSDLNCRVEVMCGQTTLYGMKGVGYMVCDIEDRKPTFAEDAEGTADDNDPRASLDLEKRRVVVSDAGYAVTVALRER